MAKRKLIVFILIAFLASGIASHADAQFWKRKDKRHARKHRHDTENTAADEQKGEVVEVDKRETRIRERMERKRLKRERRRMRHKDTAGDDDMAVQYHKPAHGKRKKKQGALYPATQMKPAYRIDFLASLYLDELSKDGALANNAKIPGKAYPGISFYEGMNIAADSLKKAGFNIDIYVHDIASENQAPDKLVANGSLDSADLIIGAFHSQDMTLVAEYAKKKQVNFISALSPADGGIKDNQFFTMTQPSLRTHCEWIMDDVEKKFPDVNVILMHRASTQVDENAFNYLNNYNNGNVHFKQLICNVVPDRQSLLPLIDTMKTNVVIISVIDPNYADSLLNELSGDFPNTHFEIYGMPSWYVIDDLHDNSAFPNLSVNVTVPFNVDLSAPVSRYVARMYKKDYGGKSSELVYRGYETLFWYASLLKEYGTIFDTHYDDINSAPFTQYEIKLEKDKDGNVLYQENTHVYLTKYGYGGGSKAD